MRDAGMRDIPNGPLEQPVVCFCFSNAFDSGMVIRVCDNLGECWKRWSIRLRNKGVRPNWWFGR
jgi:hypothetical protein